MDEWTGYVRDDHGVDRRGLMFAHPPARVVEEHRLGYDLSITDKDTKELLQVTVRIEDRSGAFWYTTDPETARRLVDGTVMLALLLEEDDG